MIVTLTPQEAYYGACVGVKRRIRSIQSGLKEPRYTLREDQWGRDVMGAMAELATCKGLNFYWPAGVDTFKLCDAANIQIRFTWLTTGRLIIRPNDDDNQRFLLVTPGPIGSCLSFNLKGWIKAADAKLPKWVDSPNDAEPCWMFPQELLHPIEELNCVEHQTVA